MVKNSGRNYFNPLPPYGGRLNSPWRLDNQESFQSTPSVWRETQLAVHDAQSLVISIHSLRMEGDVAAVPTHWNKLISIHSLRMEGDERRQCSSHPQFRISIHSLRMEGDLEQPQALRGVLVFQSTPSVWRETIVKKLSNFESKISIHSLRMEGDEHLLRRNRQSLISIHSLRMEGDISIRSECKFFSISIHSLRMEGDKP